MGSQQICLKWNSFQSNIVTSFEHLWEEEGLVDVTLASEGQCIRAHKVILSACSPFFRRIFETNPCQHPVIILQDVHFPELEALLCFVYKGEVNIEQDDLPALLKAAESLQIRGLCNATNNQNKIRTPNHTSDSNGSPPAKRQRSSSSSLPPPPLPALPPLHRAKNKRQRVETALSEERSTSPPPATLAKSEPSCDPACEDSESLASLPLEESMDEGTPEDLQTIIQQPHRSSGTRHGEKLSLADINQLKGCCRTDSLAFHADLNFDPALADKSASFPPFPCPFCDRAYTSWGFRRRHIKSMHTQSPQLSCKWCMQILSSHDVWQDHVTRKHGLSSEDAHNGLLILEEAHMVLQIPNPTRLDSLVDMIRRGEATTASTPEYSGGPSREKEDTISSSESCSSAQKID
ncbi:hypothetical protein B566_EDAN005268 [Ephemera danica]|nr:hypothetical protein B566_EDAN005268 [Ephemera danica]